MNRYEQLVDELTRQGVTVDETTLQGGKVKGLYVQKGGSALIGVDGSLPVAEKTCILAEEAGHHHRTVGRVLAQATPTQRKAENAGRRWAFEQCLPLETIARIRLENPDLPLGEMAPLMEVTESFLIDAVEHYHRRYGSRRELPSGLTVQFDPYFDVWVTGQPHEEFTLYCRSPRGLDTRHRDRLMRYARRLFNR